MFGRSRDTRQDRQQDQAATPDAPPHAGTSEAPRLAPKSPHEAIKPEMASPPPPRRLSRPRGGLLSTLSGLFSMLAVVALIALVGLVVLARQANQPGPLQADTVVAIPQGTGMSGIARILERERVITQPLLFQLYAVLNREQANLKAGEFAFRANVSIADAIDTLTEGRAVLHQVTIPEGLTSLQIVERLRRDEVLTGEIETIPPEGSLMPDTYKFERGTTRAQVVEIMSRAQERALAEIWARRAEGLPLETPDELVILASIVEKETGRADERPRVAGVFINRLRQGMRLQSDPTIVYGLVGGRGTLGRGILRTEIREPTPYNTYVIDGLPPTPIANPGRAAMEAVANPSRTNDLFFVADGTGGHAFSETYDEHRRAVSRWREIEASRGSGETDMVDPEDIPDEAPQSGALPGGALPGGALPGGAAPGSLPSGGVPGATPNAAALVPVRGTIDASEGTPLDPLANTTFDLTNTQVVPDLPAFGEDGAVTSSAAPASGVPLPPPRPSL
ncbi:endolytic transglycosylase MltG [Salinarimonas ramus]|uniref:Endolytic murein transglycosylase n=1 Tax=Salinarimonas ramus TaxID=690164 RepID=A0A917Q523_9HYPH|nr:endolytic transglycosylase MltG [Salinarimonas ramus]GGK27240.1 aminodeoxychorismate lyase [Salinarimonas ramus]